MKVISCLGSIVLGIFTAIIGYPLVEKGKMSMLTMTNKIYYES